MKFSVDVSRSLRSTRAVLAVSASIERAVITRASLARERHMGLITRRMTYSQSVTVNTINLSRRATDATTAFQLRPQIARRRGLARDAPSPTPREDAREDARVLLLLLLGDAPRARDRDPRARGRRDRAPSPRAVRVARPAHHARASMARRDAPGDETRAARPRRGQLQPRLARADKAPEPRERYGVVRPRARRSRDAPRARAQ